MCKMNEQDVADALQRLAAVQPDDQSSQRAMQRVRETLAAPGLSPETPERPLADVPVRPRRLKMTWKQAKWMIPLAAAAAILLAVGIWSGGHSKNGKPQAGAAYAFGDMPAVIGKARYLHIQGKRTFHMGSQDMQFPIDSWFDLQTGARRTTYTLGAVFKSATVVSSGDKAAPPQPSQAPVIENTMRTVESVFDGQYEMLLDLDQKTASFTRLSPVRQRIEAASAGTSVMQQLIGDPYQLAGFSIISKENLNGVVCEVWGREDSGQPAGTPTKRTYCWFAPQTGAAVKVQEWTKDSVTGQYNESMLLDRIERDVTPPAGTFETVPPADYTATNTKETAPVKDLQAKALPGTQAESSMRARAGSGTPTGTMFVAAPPVKTYPGFVLPDGSIVMGMSSQSAGGYQFAGATTLTPEQMKDLQSRIGKDGSPGKIVVWSSGTAATQSSGTIPPEVIEKLRQQGMTIPADGKVVTTPATSLTPAPAVPQDQLFANLAPGGDLPKLPTEVYGLKAANAPVTYTGKHLAWTKKGTEWIEWAIYIPDSPPPANLLGLHLLTRSNAPGTADTGAKTGVTMSVTRVIVQPPIPVSATNFNDLVAASMAELSDNGTAPQEVSFDYVSQLAQQIRASVRK